MKKFFATLLLVCYGVILPVAASPVRICLLEERERTPDCCEKCPSTHKDCCAEMDTLPDSPVPTNPTDIPPFVAAELASFIIGDFPEVVGLPQAPAFSQPIRGPDTPAAYRSVLGVWSI